MNIFIWIGVSVGSIVGWKVGGWLADKILYKKLKKKEGKVEYTVLISRREKKTIEKFKKVGYNE